MEFVGEGVPLGENGIETTDESNISGGIQGKFVKLKRTEAEWEKVHEKNGKMIRKSL